MANAGEIGLSRKGEHRIGYTTRTKARECSISLEPIYKSTLTGYSAQSEQEVLARNAQLKMNWENRCQKQMEI